MKAKFINPRDLIELYTLDGLTGGESDELERFPIEPNVLIESAWICGIKFILMFDAGNDQCVFPVNNLS